MVVVGNELLTNNDDQKPKSASPTTPSAVGAIALNNRDIDTELPEKTKPAADEAVASTIKRKKNQYAAIMEEGKKVEDDHLFEIRDMNELIAADKKNEEAIENQENNNMQVCDSNTNTLQGVSSLDRRATAQLPTAVSQQVLNLAMKSVLNANNSGIGVGVTSSGSLFSSLGALNSSALQREQATDCGTLLLSSVVPTALESTTTSSTGDAKIVLQCEAKSHKFDTRSILLQPNQDCKEAVQREKTLKAKLSSLQGVLDTTRKNSAMCWQSMITEDQLLHKINLLEKKLQTMEKNIPENALRNEIVKLLEDKTAYQLTAKEALQKVYQERCEAMQMLSKMEMSYATSENECTILRAQVLTSKQTMLDFNARLEQLQQEYTEYKQETLRQRQKAKEQEEKNLELLKEKLTTQAHEVEKLRLQVTQLQQSIVENDSGLLQENDVLDQLDAIIANDEEYDNKGHASDGREDQKTYTPNIMTAPQNHFIMNVDQHSTESASQKEMMRLSEPDLEKIICNSSVIKLLKNSDLCKTEDGTAVLKAIFNDKDEDSKCRIMEGDGKIQASNAGTDLVLSEFNTGIKQERAETVEEIVQNYSRFDRLNEINEQFKKSPSRSPTHKFDSQNTLVWVGENHYNPTDFPTEQAIEMLQEECYTYKKKTEHLTVENHSMREKIDILRKQLEQELKNEKRQDDSQDNTEIDWKDDKAAINNSQVEQEEELIVYKERLEHSERCNLELRNEISDMRLNQQHILPEKQLLLHRVLPVGCIVIALLIYLFSNRI
ncbi:sarcolemmal membrane-associated protein isoform X2 [Drosophila biarmipes]|uniref:sarcolemmal membrane-associated protein isoform X2 n=1 Tax=Drosophila biarmipes TaxID=125945 RepID=UPI0007E61E19|nr:sarcolemmal membrane-associated protein isoform X2 [Drosophila biarmipes]